MNNELKEKLVEMLHDYDRDLEYLWQSSDSGDTCRCCREQQKKVADLITELEGEAKAKAEVVQRHKHVMEREQELERVFNEYDFSPKVVKDAGGWAHDSPDVYHRTVFFENGDEPSTFAIFSVTFKQNSAKILDIGI